MQEELCWKIWSFDTSDTAREVAEIIGERVTAIVDGKNLYLSGDDKIQEIEAGIRGLAQEYSAYNFTVTQISDSETQKLLNSTAMQGCDAARLCERLDDELRKRRMPLLQCALTVDDARYVIVMENGSTVKTVVTQGITRAMAFFTKPQIFKGSPAAMQKFVQHNLISFAAGDARWFFAKDIGK